MRLVTVSFWAWKMCNFGTFYCPFQLSYACACVADLNKDEITMHSSGQGHSRPRHWRELIKLHSYFKQNLIESSLKGGRGISTTYIRVQLVTLCFLTLCFSMRRWPSWPLMPSLRRVTSRPQWLPLPSSCQVLPSTLWTEAPLTMNCSNWVCQKVTNPSLASMCRVLLIIWRPFFVFSVAEHSTSLCKVYADNIAKFQLVFSEKSLRG